MDTLNEWRAHGGVQSVHAHASLATGTDMTFSVFTPPGDGPFPVLLYLSGLTCTHANVTEKGEYRAACAEHGIVFVAPDTSPRGDGVPDAEGYDFGQGAGFYVDATQEPWREHFNMRSYVEDELVALLASRFPQADTSRLGVTGHSMGGHGALTVALRNPAKFRSVSALAPICAPSQVPWGEKAFAGYLGEDRSAWARHDTVALIEGGARVPEILVDQGTEDQFLEEQLRPDLLQDACTEAGIELTLRLQAGYDHSYYFISSFMAEHVAWHAERLGA